MSLPEIPVDLWRSFQQTIFGEKADAVQDAESFRWGVDDALGQLPPDDGDWQAEVRRLEEEQRRRQEEQQRQIEEQARRDQEDYERIADERAVAARANELAAASTYNDPTAGGTQTQPLPPQSPAPASFADTASSLMQQTFGPEPSSADAPPVYPGLTPGAVSAVTSTTHGLIDDIIRPRPMPEDASDSERFVQHLSRPNEPRPPALRNEIPYDPETNTYGPNPNPPEPLSFADTASSLIAGTFGPEIADTRDADQEQHELPRPEPGILERAGSAASTIYEGAVRGGVPDVVGIARRGSASARETIDTFGAGALSRDMQREQELQAEQARFLEEQGRTPTAAQRFGQGDVDPEWEAASPDRAEELRRARDTNLMAVGGMAGTGSGRLAQDAVSAIKALRSAGVADDVILAAERNLAEGADMALSAVQRLTRGATQALPEAAPIPKPPLETPTGPQTGDAIRLPDGTRARVEEPTALAPTTFEPPRAEMTDGPQPGDRVRLPDGTRARVEEPPTDLAPTIYEPSRSNAGDGGGAPPPPSPPATPPPGMYTTMPPPGPLATTTGGGGLPAAGGPPGGGGNLPPVGSLYRGGGSSSKGLPSLKSIGRWLVRQNTDRRVDLNDLQKSVSREIGRPLNPDELVSELSRRNTNHAADVIQREELRPIFTSMGEDLPYLSEALTYLDNIAVSRALGNPNRTFSWGLTAAESQARLPQLVNQLGGVNDPRAQRLNKAIQGIRAYTDSYRRRMLDSGVWSQELYDDLTTRYPTYIPTRILDYLKDNAAVGSGQKLGLSDRGLRSHTLAGTALEREDPLASIVRLGYDSEKRIHQNEVFNAFVKLRDVSPGLQQAVRQVPTNYTPKQGETLVHGFVDGEKRVYAMSDPIAQTVMMADGQSLPGFVRGVTNGFRALITRSPVFIAGQIPLDAFGYAVRESGRSKYGPLALPQIGVDLVRAYAEAFRGLATGEFKGDAAALLKEGGGMGGWQGRTPEATKSRVSELAHRNMFEIRNKGDVARLVRWIATMQPVAAVGERVELAPRIASYRRAGRRTTDQTTTALVQPAQGGPPIPVPQQGQRPLSSVERVMAARDVTLDFERGGLLSRVLNQAIPFYNVGWQSSAGIARAVRENPVGFSASALSIVGGLAVGAEAWNRSDPQLEKDYEDVPDYIKDRGVVFMLPGNAPLDKDGNRRPNYLTIPMRELAPIAILAREAALKVAGKDRRTWGEILGASAAAASPIQATGAADLFSTVNPIGANTALQLATDKDFFRGQRIDTKFRSEEASAASKALSATARQHGLEWSPAQIEFALRDLGGGASRAGLAASDMLAGTVKDDSRIQNTPLAGDLIRRYVGDATGGVMNREREQTIKPATRARLRAGGVEYVPGPVDFELEGVPLLRAEVGTLQASTNRHVETEISRALAHPKWATWTPAQRDEVIRDATAAARERARAELVRSIGAAEFRRRARATAQPAGR